MTLPTIVLVHGAWHTPPNYQTFITALQTQGFTVHCPRLPSCSGSSPPAASLPEDIAYIRTLLTSLSDEGARIVLLMHSYGGAVGTDATDGLAFSDRKAAGQPGGVIHLLYLCAYILPPDTAIWNIVQEAGMDKLWDQFIHTDKEDGVSESTFPLDPGLMFFGGDEGAVSDRVVEEAKTTLVRFPMSALMIPVKGISWMSIPVTYVMTQKDYSVPRVYQDLMVGRVKGAGVQLRIEDYDTSHSIFITREKDMVRLAVEAAKEAANDQRNPV